jgi:hypothetical protein
MTAASVVASVLALAVPACATHTHTHTTETETVPAEIVEAWPETQNAGGGTATSDAKLDFEAISKAYREAESPEDFEQRVNEIYTGDEIVSIAVEDQNDQTQLVTGFIDKNGNETVDEGEKIFSIKRTPTGSEEQQTAQYVTTGYSYDVGVGYYPYYTSPYYPLAWGAGTVAVGAMAAMAWRGAAYAPYRYATSAARVGALNTYRGHYRAANPQRFDNAGARQANRNGNAAARQGNRSNNAAARQANRGSRSGTSRPSGGYSRPSGGYSRPSGGGFSRGGGGGFRGGGGGGRFGLPVGRLAGAVRLTE